MRAISEQAVERVEGRSRLEPHERAAVDRGNFKPAITRARGFVRAAEAELEATEIFSRHETVRGLLRGDLDERLPEIEKAEASVLALRREIERWHAVVRELEQRAGIIRDSAGFLLSR